MKKMIQKGAAGVFIMIFLIAYGAAKNNIQLPLALQQCNNKSRHSDEKRTGPAVTDQLNGVIVKDIQDYNYNIGIQVDLNYPFY